MFERSSVLVVGQITQNQIVIIGVKGCNFQSSKSTY